MTTPSAIKNVPVIIPNQFSSTFSDPGPASIPNCSRAMNIKKRPREMAEYKKPKFCNEQKTMQFILIMKMRNTQFKIEQTINHLANLAVEATTTLLDLFIPAPTMRTLVNG